MLPAEEEPLGVSEEPLGVSGAGICDGSRMSPSVVLGASATQPMAHDVTPLMVAAHFGGHGCVALLLGAPDAGAVQGRGGPCGKPKSCWHYRAPLALPPPSPVRNFPSHTCVY
jgi:hypothetical protein